MKLFERYADRGYHTCIATTFGIDFDAYEQIVLPRLRGAGCYNNLVLADQPMLSHALMQPLGLPAYAGRHYTISGITASGVFHPKLTLQLGGDRGRLMISSANLSASGLAGNLELVGQLNIPPGDDASESGEARLIAAALAYLTETLAPHDQDQAVQHQLQWMRARTPWLEHISPAIGLETLVDGTEAALLISGGAQEAGIGHHFAELVGERPVERLIVVSPYWDHDLSAVRQLADDLDAQRVALLIDKVTARFPSNALAKLPNLELYDLAALSAPGAAKRFIHAKAFIAETADADHLLFGSANATRNALGIGAQCGVNHEASLYRRQPARTLLNTLGLAPVITPAHAVAASELPAFVAEETRLPADEGHEAPGIFECQSDWLSWRLSSPRQATAEIELLDRQGDRISAELIPQQAEQEGRRHYLISGADDRPRFARLRYEDGTRSAPAIVRQVDELYATVRVRRDTKGEKAVRELAEATEVGLWLWDVLAELERGMHQQVKELAPGRSDQERSPEAEASEPTPTARLSYEDFIQGRQRRSNSSAIERNSLLGSDYSLARDCLNRLHGKLARIDDTPEREDVTTTLSLDTGDETGDGERALVQGLVFSEAPSGDHSAEQATQAARYRRTRENQASVVSAVGELIKRLKVKRGAVLDSSDLFRVRAMLAILATLAQPANGGTMTSELQVLPFGRHQTDWPVLMGKLLSCMFGGNRPAVRDLAIEAHHDQLPDDIIECWAMAMWSIQACRQAAATYPDKLTSQQAHFEKLASNLYLWTLPEPEVLSLDKLSTEYDRVNHRYAARLGLDHRAIRTGHESNVAARQRWAM